MKNCKISRILGFTAISLIAPAFIAACAGSPKTEAEVVPATPAPIEPTHLHADMEPRSKSKVKGHVHFETEGDTLTVKYFITGLKGGSKHGFHIHAKGDCSAPDASSAGDHFNPSGAPHGDVTAALRHEGDFGNIQANKMGVAKGELKVTGIKLSDIKGLAVIVHAKVDDGKTQPSGASGERIACGILQ